MTSLTLLNTEKPEITLASIVVSESPEIGLSSFCVTVQLSPYAG